jgi:hypothetical protein
MHHLQNKKSFESVEESPTSLVKIIDVKIIRNNFTFIQKNSNDQKQQRNLNR